MKGHLYAFAAIFAMPNRYTAIIVEIHQVFAKMKRYFVGL
jgi:hypothetical protein